MSEEQQAGSVKLSLNYPTIFPDLNAKNQSPANHLTKEISVQRMKFKHFRKMQGIAEAKQLPFIMRELTNLSDNDLDELDAEDSARLSEIIFSFMMQYAEVAKKMMKD